MKHDDLDSLLEVVGALARTAGERALMHYHADYAQGEKDDGSVVTSVDIELNQIISEGLLATSIPVLSEEGDHDIVHELAHSTVWVVDPLDGTCDFVQKTGDFAIMIGLVQCGEPVLGAVYVPVADKLYLAARGRGAYCEQGGVRRRLSVSRTSDPHDTRIVGSRNHQSLATTAVADAFKSPNVLLAGSNGVKCGLIAEDIADVFVSSTNKMGWWDICAPQIILEEAGGRFTGIDGARIVYGGPTAYNPHGIVVTNGHVHDDTVAALAAAHITPQ